MSQTTHELPVVESRTEEDLERWMAEHHREAQGVWVKIAKAGVEDETITFDEAVHVGLCYGWIDGLRRGAGRDYYLQKLTPAPLDRDWNWVECDKAEWLIEQGRMQPEGMALVEAARADGRWERAYEARGDMRPPADLQARLASYPEAREFFNSLDERNRNAIVLRLKPPAEREARQMKLDQIVQMLLRHEKPY